MDDKRSRPGYLTKYAKHAGMSIASASEALRRVGIDYMEPFDFADADRRREAARHADRVPFSKPVYGQSDAGANPAGDPLDTDPHDSPLQSFSEAQTRERHFKAKLAELEFLERSGSLVSVEKVEAEAFRIGRQVRDALLNLPDRLAGVFAAETDQRKIHDSLTKEIRQALEALAEGESDRRECHG
ncbi:MAG: hypothetical protein JSS39_14510 [Nitrospira sp.]|nr:hypothetical protein [Nitrospira sp.]